MKRPWLLDCLLFLSVLLGAGGCGQHAEKTEPAPPPAPIAIKTIRFGSDSGKVERFFSPLQKVSDAFGIAVYAHVPKDSDTIDRYLFEFIDGKLDEVSIIYKAPEFDKLIGAKAFFQKLQTKYDATVDLGAGQGLWRWFNLRRHITITWQRNFRKKRYILTIRWDKMDALRRKHYERMRGARRKSGAPKPPPSPKADLGF